MSRPVESGFLGALLTAHRLAQPTWPRQEGPHQGGGALHRSQAPVPRLPEGQGCVGGAGSPAFTPRRHESEASLGATHISWVPPLCSALDGTGVPQQSAPEGRGASWRKRPWAGSCVCNTRRCAWSFPYRCLEGRTAGSSSVSPLPHQSLRCECRLEAESCGSLPPPITPPGPCYQPQGRCCRAP